MWLGMTRKMSVSREPEDGAVDDGVPSCQPACRSQASFLPAINSTAPPSEADSGHAFHEGLRGRLGSQARVGLSPSHLAPHDLWSTTSSTPRLPSVSLRDPKASSVGSLRGPSRRDDDDEDNADAAHLCRSPSCPALCSEDMVPDITAVQQAELGAAMNHIMNRTANRNKLSLPDIFSNSSTPRANKSEHTARRDADMNCLSRKRQSTSLKRSSSRDTELRSNGTAPRALLLPIGTTQMNGGKVKPRPKPDGASQDSGSHSSRRSSTHSGPKPEPVLEETPAREAASQDVHTSAHKCREWLEYVEHQPPQD